MKSSTRLDSAVFQLTPTRTRCDLVINANGRTEKIASGLVNPFLAHLKTAQDQMAKGGYSIILEPEPGMDASWFTRGTVERFVRFVSTPEILERVYTLESEILQIEEAIAIQSNNDVSEMVDNHLVKPPERSEGSKHVPDTNEKAIVLYKPGENSVVANGSNSQEENSKAQLMKVLETRRSVLQKEQGMAFARAVAAGFDIDHMPPLMSFGQSFGASRLLDACKRFKELWKRKHETGQWVEIEAAEAMSNRAEFPAMNASGIVLSNNQWPATPGSNGKTATASSGDEKSPMNQQPPFQGQFPPPMYAPWPIQSPPGTAPVFPGYPMQFPYYQNYPGNGPFVSPPYPSDSGQRTGHGNISQDTGETDVELGDNRETKRKSSRSSKSKSGKVVIRNINYITSKRDASSGSESQSASGSEEDEEDQTKNSRRSSKKREIQTSELVLYDQGTNNNESDGRNWEAFQSYLLDCANDAESGTNKDMSNENSTHKKRVSNDELLLLRKMGQSSEGGSQMDMQSEVNGQRARFRSKNDEFVINRQENQLGYSSTDPMAVNGFVHPRKDIGRNDDYSHVVSLRSSSLDRGGDDSRPAINMDSEILLSHPENSGKRVGGQGKYEPDDFSLMAERDSGNALVGYDPALDYEAENRVSLDKKRKEAVTGAKQGAKKVDKNSKSRLAPDKKTLGPIRKGKPSKLSPLEEARARAEKLRNYKADLQKMKKEKEEQEIKRLEALKIERQKRIASRGGSIPAMPTSQQTRKQLPAKLSPSPHKSSKFSDSEPGSRSPLQRSKVGKLSTTTHSAGNRLSRSVSSLPEPKKENSTITPDSKASVARIRRLSEPKMISSSSPVTSLKPRKPEPVSKPKISTVPETKKLSAIVNHDKNKIASLPELKIKTARKPDSTNGKSAAKEVPQNANEGQSNSSSNDTKMKRNGDESSNHSNGDESPIIEKKVLIQESEKSSTEIASTAEKDIPKCSIISPSEKPYKAPFARNSSMEDECTRNSEYGKAPPSCLQKTTGTETLKAHVSDPSIFRLEKIPEVVDKPQTKESSKGFRRLLKFGKKNHSSSDNVSVNGSEADDGAANTATSSEVFTLKNLISQDETSSANTTPQKTSRHFSLLSPFRSKSSEKKLST